MRRNNTFDIYIKELEKKKINCNEFIYVNILIYINMSLFSLFFENSIKIEKLFKEVKNLKKKEEEKK